MNPKFKMMNTSTQEDTVLLQIENEHSKTFVPRRLKWNDCLLYTSDAADDLLCVINRSIILKFINLRHSFTR